MKRLSSVIVVVLLITACLVMSVNAFDLHQAAPSIDGSVIFDLNATEGAGWVGDTIFNWEGGESYCVKMDTYVYYPFTAPSDGVYTVVVEFVGREGANRAFDIEIDDGGRQFIDITESNDHQWAAIEFTTTAGDHQFRLWSPTDMDDSTLKSVDIYHVSLYLTEEIIPVTEAPSEPAAEAAPEPAAVVSAPVTAPQTADPISIAAVVLLTSAFGFAATKKRK